MVLNFPFCISNAVFRRSFNSVSKITSIPIIASGGFGKIEDLELATKAGADAVAIAHMIHYKKLNLREIRDHLLKKNIKVRKFNQ